MKIAILVNYLGIKRVITLLRAPQDGCVSLVNARLIIL